MSALDILDQIDVVLIGTSHPGNIGAAARAVKTMGLRNLVLVNPKSYPHPDASQRSAGAEDVLNAARVEKSLSAALSHATWVVGTSARSREVNWPMFSPRAAAEQAVEHLQTNSAGRIAVLFGNETSGLSNSELDYCSAQIVVPANPVYGSLNLASAVQIVSYELRLAALPDAHSTDLPRQTKPRQTAATQVQKQGHLDHLAEVLEQLDFAHNKNSPLLMRKLTRLYNKAELTEEEVQILRGILTAIQNRKVGS